MEGVQTATYTDGAGVDPHALDEKSLTRFLAAEFVADTPWEACFGATAARMGDEERARALASVGRVLSHLVANTPADWRTIESLVWMMAEYTHRYLDIDPRLDVASHLLHAARAEPALHAMQAYYRDHFFHALEVCLLGHLLLVTEPSSNPNGADKGASTPLWETVSQHLRARRQRSRDRAREAGGKAGPPDIKLDDVTRQWYLTALLHDVG
jgi:hypothetical protein